MFRDAIAARHFPWVIIFYIAAGCAKAAASGSENRRLVFRYRIGSFRRTLSGIRYRLMLRLLTPFSAHIYFHPHNTTFFYGFQHYSLFFIYYSVLYQLFQYLSLIVEVCVSVKEGLYE